MSGLSWPETVAAVALADRLGYDTIWLSEAWGHEVFSRLAHLACHTQRIQLGCGIANVYSRSPALLAQSAATVDLVSDKRLKLGLGTSGRRVVEGWHGVAFGDGLERLKETVEVIRLILAGQRLSYRGSVFQLDSGLKLLEPAPRKAVPIYLGTLTPGGLGLAGELADGWISVFFSPLHFADVIAPHLRRGARSAGRELPRVCVFQPVIVTDDLARGRDRARPGIALYVGGMGTREHNYYNRLFCAYGFEKEAREVQDHYLAGRRQEAVAAVTDQMVDLVTIVGSAATCRRRLEELGEAGVDEVALEIFAGSAPGGLSGWLEAMAPAA